MRIKVRQREPRVWCTSDVHGCYEEFKRLIAAIGLTSSDTLYVIGDCVNKGPNSRGVIRHIMQRNNIFALRGNHEQLMLNAYRNEASADFWLRSGGIETLNSFGLDPDNIHRIPRMYINWLNTLPYFKQLTVEGKQFVLSHAGVDLSSKNPYKTSPKNLSYILWNRTVRNKSRDTTLVIGHTPRKLSMIRASLNTNIIRIDGGCVYGGKLVAVCLNDLSIKYV